MENSTGKDIFWCLLGNNGSWHPAAYKLQENNKNLTKTKMNYNFKSIKMAQLENGYIINQVLAQAATAKTTNRY